MQCQPQPVHKLKFKFKPGSVPAYLGLSYIGCSTCDKTLKNDLQFGPIKRSNPNPNESSKRTIETIQDGYVGQLDVTLICLACCMGGSNCCFVPHLQHQAKTTVGPSGVWCSLDRTSQDMQAVKLCS